MTRQVRKTTLHKLFAGVSDAAWLSAWDTLLALRAEHPGYPDQDLLMLALAKRIT